MNLCVISWGHLLVTIVTYFTFRKSNSYILLSQKVTTVDPRLSGMISRIFKCLIVEHMIHCLHGLLECEFER